MVTESIDKQIRQVLERHNAIRLALLFGSLAKGSVLIMTVISIWQSVPIIRSTFMKQSNLFQILRKR